MKHKNITLSILLLGLGLTTRAQQAATATGGDGVGSGGAISYSIGQMGHTIGTGSNGSVAQGVQQAYEISVALGVENQQISLGISAYPNPTTHFLTLTIENSDYSALNYQLLDLSGRLIKSQKMTSSAEIIGMENLPTATYFLKVTNNNKAIKTFKIIKN